MLVDLKEDTIHLGAEVGAIILLFPIGTVRNAETRPPRISRRVQIPCGMTVVAS